MFVRVSTLCAVLSLGLVVFVRAQADRPKGTTIAAPESATAPTTQANKPDPQIDRLLKALSGTWSISEELAPDATHPKGISGSGTIVWRPGPGGSSIVEDYRSKQGDQVISGLGIFWWDPAAQGYHTIWCDSTNPGGCIDFKNAVRWDGQVLVLQEDYELNGKKYTFREVFGDITPDAFTQTLYGGEAGGALKVDQVIHAKRLKTGAS